MASLVLGVVGGVVGGIVGGPIGASIGWMLGSALGSALDPQKIQGPKLTDLKVQGTEYGTPIPIVYGSVRIAGCCVLWKSDLIPHEQKTGSKKQEVVNTTYSCSFAIQLCEGEIESVARVWADNRLVWEDGAGSIDFLLYLGDEEQMPDPTAEALYGVGNVPAHRGYAYVSFTDLALTDYGNRVPNFTFEVVTIGEGITGSIRRIEQQYDSGFFYNYSAGAYYLTPAITHWPMSGGEIRIKQVGHPDPPVAASFQEFDRATMTYTGTGTIHDDFPIAFRAEPDFSCGTPYLGWNMNPIGIYVYADDATVPLWVLPSQTIGITNIGPALYDGAVNQVDCGIPHSARNILHLAGLPDDHYVGGVALSANGRKLYVFTAPSDVSSGAFVIDTWYEIIDGELARSGTVIPNKSLYQLGFGCANSFNTNSIIAEDNGRYFWTYWGNEGVPSGGVDYNGGVVRLYEIDDSGNFAFIPFPGTGEFNIDTAGGTCPMGEDGNIASNETGLRGSIYVIRTGYVGVVGANNFGVFTRFVEGSDDLVHLSDIVADLSLRAGLDESEIDVTELTDLVHGYVIANQADVRSGIAPLQTAYFFDAVESGALIKFPKRGQEPILTIPDAELAAHEDKGEAPALLEFARAQEVDLPRRITTTYLDFNAAYQSGSQNAQRMVTSSLAEMSVQLPIALDGNEAKRIADRLLWSAWYERDSFTFTTPRKYAYLEPTDTIIAGGRSLRISTREEQPGGVIKWTGVQSIGAVFTSDAGGAGGTGGGVDGGGNLPPPLVLPQDTDLELLDIAYIADPARQNVYWAAMAGAERPSWRGAALYRSKDAINYDDIAESYTADVIGSVDTVLGSFLGGNVFDEVNSVDVTIGLGGGELSSTTRDAILNGANEYALGSEILQARDAVLTSGSTYTLTGFLRGRRGTEWAMPTHVVGERFVVLPTNNELSYATSDISLSRQYKAVTFGNTLASAESEDFILRGVSMTPYSPVFPSAGINAGGDWILQWIRRARVNGTWLNFADVPLDEPTEAYRVTLWTDAQYLTVAATVDCATTTTTMTAAQQTTIFGSPQSVLYWSVAQIGRLGPGYDTLGRAPVVATPPPTTPTPPPATDVPPMGEQWHPEYVFAGSTHAELNANWLLSNYGTSWAWAYVVASASNVINVFTSTLPDGHYIVNVFAGAGVGPPGVMVPWAPTIMVGPVLHSDHPMVSIPLPYADNDAT